MRSFQSLFIAGLIVLAFVSRAEAQLSGSLDLQTNCERGLAGIKLSGGTFQLPVAGGGAYQCFGFIAAIQQLSTVYVEGHSLINLCLPERSNLFQLVRVVVAYGQKHPEKLSEGNAAVFVINALADAFPCP
jgi:hypothetical protein